MDDPNYHNKYVIASDSVFENNMLPVCKLKRRGWNASTFSADLAFVFKGLNEL